MEPIAAISTGNTAAAIGIVRISGDGCFALCDRVFRAKNGKPLSEQADRRMIFGTLLDQNGCMVDQGLVVRFSEGHSYTGEDSAEFHCHGSPVVLREILSALFAAGARQAGPGEFTKRAFLNGKLDLTEAEAVIDLIDAETAAAARNAAAQLEGGLRRKLEPVRAALIDVASRFYAVVDYPDEDIEDVHPEQIARALQESEQVLSALLSSAGRGKVLKRGVRTAIIGRPNVGKSSLLNALLGYDRAIVTEIAGTTRDTVEDSAVVGGVLLRLIDTAGIRETDDAVEAIGVARSRQAAEKADFILALTDGTRPLEDGDREILDLAAQSGKPWLHVRTKCDLGLLPADGETPYLAISSMTGAGLDALERAAADFFPAGDGAEIGAILTDARQEDAVSRARDAVVRAKQALQSGLTPDAVLTDAEQALDALGELTGQTAKEEIVGAIFSRFCVGK